VVVVLEKGRAATVLDCACPVQGDTKILRKSTKMHWMRSFTYGIQRDNKTTRNCCYFGS